MSICLGCKSKKSSKSQPSPAMDSTQTVIDNALVGNWATNCNADELGGAVYSETLFTINGEVTHHSTLYNDTKCSDKSATITIKGTYTTGKILTNPSNAKELDLYYSRSIFTPYNAETVEQLNVEKACNQQWVINVGQDITEETCLGDTPESRKIKSLQIYRVSDSILEIGENSQENSPSVRPTTLSPDRLTKKPSTIND